MSFTPTPLQLAQALRQMIQDARVTLPGRISSGGQGGSVNVALDEPYKGRNFLTALAGPGCDKPGDVVCFLANNSQWVAVGAVSRRVSRSVVTDRRNREQERRQVDQASLFILTSAIDGNDRVFYVNGGEVYRGDLYEPFTLFDTQIITTPDSTNSIFYYGFVEIQTTTSAAPGCSSSSTFSASVSGRTVTLTASMSASAPILPVTSGSGSGFAFGLKFPSGTTFNYEITTSSAFGSVAREINGSTISSSFPPVSGSSSTLLTVATTAQFNIAFPTVPASINTTIQLVFEMPLTPYRSQIFADKSASTVFIDRQNIVYPYFNDSWLSDWQEAAKIPIDTTAIPDWNKPDGLNTYNGKDYALFDSNDNQVSVIAPATQYTIKSSVAGANNWSAQTKKTTQDSFIGDVEDWAAIVK